MISGQILIISCLWFLCGLAIYLIFIEKIIDSLYYNYPIDKAAKCLLILEYILFGPLVWITCFIVYIKNLLSNIKSIKFHKFLCFIRLHTWKYETTETYVNKRHCIFCGKEQEQDQYDDWG